MTWGSRMAAQGHHKGAEDPKLANVGLRLRVHF